MSDIAAMHLVGAHGSAGVTSLAQVLAPADDCGLEAPTMPTYPWTFVVCDATVTGLDKAQMTAHELDDRDDIEVLGVVLVHKAPGGLSKALKAKLRVVQAAIGGEVYEVPFQKRWVDIPVENLPVWTPHINESRRRRRHSPVPSAVEDTCEAMCRTVVAAQRETTMEEEEQWIRS